MRHEKVVQYSVFALMTDLLYTAVGVAQGRAEVNQAISTEPWSSL